MKQKTVFFVLSVAVLGLSLGCLAGAVTNGSDATASRSDQQVTVLPVTQAAPIENLPIPDTGQDQQALTGCPETDAAKMLSYGEYLYGFYCAGCHGRQGQGFPSDRFFPPLVDSQLAISTEIQPAADRMMNTDIHHTATMFFEADALAVINYIRITFAQNTDWICPGEVTIQINP